MNSLGAAIITAIELHERLYPGSDVYAVSFAGERQGEFFVALEADHFSGPVPYAVTKAAPVARQLNSEVAAQRMANV